MFIWQVCHFESHLTSCLGYTDSEMERKRSLDVEGKVIPALHENADHLRSLYSQHLMSASSATAYGLVGLLMGFVNKVNLWIVLTLVT